MRRIDSLVPDAVVMTGVRTAVAVIRVSKKGERGEKNDGDSYITERLQKEIIQQWAKQNGVKIVQWYYEIDQSGKTTDRPGLNAAVERVIASGGPDCLVVAKLDRLCRNMTEGLMLIHKLTKRHDKAFVAVKDNIDMTNESNYMAHAFLAILLILAEWQWNSVKTYWREVNEDVVQRGIAVNAPYGYARDDARKTIIVPEEAKWVRVIFRRRAAGASWLDITDELNDKRVRGPKGNAWSSRSVRNVVKNRFYLGELRYRSGSKGRKLHADDPPPKIVEFLKENAHPAIIKHDLWQAANAVGGEARKRNSSALLAGIVRCASCGGRMMANGKGYRCQLTFSWGRCSQPAWVSREAIDAYVEEQLLDALRAVPRHKPHKAESEVAAAWRKVRAAEAALDEFLRSPTTEALRVRFGQAKVDLRTTTLMDALDAAQRELQSAQTEVLGVDAPADIVSAWPEMDVEDKRALLARLFPVIVAHPLADAYTHGVPIVDRVRIWRHDEIGCPRIDQLPGRGGVAKLVKLGSPVRAGMSASKPVGKERARKPDAVVG